MLAALQAFVGTAWAAIRQFDFERRLALVLGIGSIVSGIATYAFVTSAPTYGGSIRTVIALLNLDLILLLLLGAVIARRLVRLVLERRQGSAGSQLHTRLVGLFSVVATLPAILVAVFSVVFLGSGLEAWFSSRIRAALDNSLAVASAYLAEHREVIRADVLAMAADLNREGPILLENSAYLRQLVAAQAALRSLSEAVVFDATGRVLASSGLGVALGFEGVPQSAIDRAESGEVVALTGDSDDRVRALVRLDGFGGAFLFVGRLVDPKVLVFTERTQQVVREYQAMESQRSGIQVTSALIFIIVALLLLLAAVWLGMTFADRIAAPVSRLIAAAERVRSGDLLARVPEEGDSSDEIASLSRAFNRMTSQLDAQRRELVEANRELDERQRFTEAVLAGISGGIIGLDPERRVVLPNRSALELLGTEIDAVVGRPVVEILPEVAPLFERLLSEPPGTVEQSVQVNRGGRHRMLLVRLAAQSGAEGIDGFVLTFDDVTDLVSAQRQAAWAEVARRIAHEIKNPLTPIRLSAERLGRRFSGQIEEADREGFVRSVDTIVRQVDTIGRLVSDFSAFARMPAPIFRAESLAELIRNAILLQQPAWPTIAFTVELSRDDPLRLECDGEKVSQVLTNLLQNAANALIEHASAEAKPKITIRAARDGSLVSVEVEDNGPGFPTGDRARLLEPYVTTRAKGTGLGLAIVRKIMEEHSGKLELRDVPHGGASVRLSFPTATRGQRGEATPVARENALPADRQEVLRDIG